MRHYEVAIGQDSTKTLDGDCFQAFGAHGSDVVPGASHGEDAAIVKAGKKLLAFSCDPISGALDRIGSLSVRVTMNDIATRGVRPTWFLSSIMLPEGPRL